MLNKGMFGRCTRCGTAARMGDGDSWTVRVIMTDKPFEQRFTHAPARPNPAGAALTTCVVSRGGGAAGGTGRRTET